MDGTARHAEYHSQQWPVGRCHNLLFSQDGTSFSSASEFQNMPHSLTFTFYLPSDHQLSSHFPPIFLKPFFFYFEKTKKMKGKNCYFFFPKKEKRKFFLLSVLNQKERRAAETISAAAAGGGGG
jgi:hypothetical protein